MKGLVEEAIKQYEFSNDDHRLNGYYNDNYLIRIEERTYILRVPISNAPTMDIKIVHEEEVMAVISEHGKGIISPRVIADFYHEGRRMFLHSYIDGVTLDSLYSHSGTIPKWIVDNIAVQMAHIHEIDLENAHNILNKSSWGTTCRNFYEYNYLYIQDLVSETKKKYPKLFDALGIPNDLMPSYDRNISLLNERNYVICHNDIHRKNVLVDFDTVTVGILDWELSFVADPFYDIAIHFHKMRYSKEAEIEFIKTYLLECDIRISFENALEQIDLYRFYEEIKSACIDCTRYVEDISDGKNSKLQINDYSERYLGKLKKAYKRWDVTVQKVQTLEDVVNIFTTS